MILRAKPTWPIEILVGADGDELKWAAFKMAIFLLHGPSKGKQLAGGWAQQPGKRQQQNRDVNQPMVVLTYFKLWLVYEWCCLYMFFLLNKFHQENWGKMASHFDLISSTS